MKIKIPFIRRNKKENNTLLYNSWNDISIKKYDEIVNIAKDDGLSTMQKNIEFLSILTNKSSDEIWNMNMEDVKQLSMKASFLNDFNFDKDKKPKSIIINGMKCTIKYNLNDFSFAQFQDFQTFYQKGTENHLQHILATIIIPDEKKYGDGYDLDEFTEHLYNELPITDAQSIMFFFIISLVRSLNHTKTFLISQMKKEVKKMKNKEKKKELMERINHITGTIA